MHGKGLFSSKWGAKLKEKIQAAKDKKADSKASKKGIIGKKKAARKADAKCPK